MIPLWQLWFQGNRSYAADAEPTRKSYLSLWLKLPVCYLLSPPSGKTWRCITYMPPKHWQSIITWHSAVIQNTTVFIFSAFKDSALWCLNTSTFTCIFLHIHTHTHIIITIFSQRFTTELFPFVDYMRQYPLFCGQIFESKDNQCFYYKQTALWLVTTMSVAAVCLMSTHLNQI